MAIVIREEPILRRPRWDRWDCARHAYAAARDLACWQLGTSEADAINLISDMADTARSMKEHHQ
jgi:hypothetical protein